MNEETGNRRLVMFTTEDNEEKDALSDNEKPIKESESSSEKLIGEDLSVSETAKNSETKNEDIQPVQMSNLKSLTPEQCEKLVGYGCMHVFLSL